VPAAQEGRRHGAVSPRYRPQPIRGFAREGRRPVRHRDLAASGDTELLAEDVRVSLRRSRGDAKALADFVVRAPGGDQLDDLPLPLGDRRK
jgi:hypothetical protein